MCSQFHQLLLQFLNAVITKNGWNFTMPYFKTHSNIWRYSIPNTNKLVYFILNEYKKSMENNYFYIIIVL